MKHNLAILLIFVFCISPLAAQDEPNPLLDMLSLIPDIPETRSFLNYVDYRAMETVLRIPTPTMQDFEDNNALSELWLAAFYGTGSFWRIDDFSVYIERMSDLVGFSPFDIDRVMTFRDTPITKGIKNEQLKPMGTIFTGDFDIFQINKTLLKRGFSSDKTDSITIWCRENDCTTKPTNNLNPEQGNPFGGHLGRQEPLAIMPAYLMSSEDVSTLDRMLDAYQGEYPTLADSPDYRAIAEQVSDFGTLVAIEFFDPAKIATVDLTWQELGTPEEVQQQVAEWGELPPYSLAAVADLGQEEDALLLLMLVYNDFPSAKSAAITLVNRLGKVRTVTGTRRNYTLMESFDILNAYLRRSMPTIQRSRARDRYVFIFPIPSYLPSNELFLAGENDHYWVPNAVFSTLVKEIEAGLPWLGTDFILPE